MSVTFGRWQPFIENFHVTILRLCDNILKYRFISVNADTHDMITEAITIGSILGVSGAIAWLAKVKFQPDIERSISGPETKEEAIVARKSHPKAH